MMMMCRGAAGQGRGRGRGRGGGGGTGKDQDQAIVGVGGAQKESEMADESSARAGTSMSTSTSTSTSTNTSTSSSSEERRNPRKRATVPSSKSLYNNEERLKKKASSAQSKSGDSKSLSSYPRADSAEEEEDFIFSNKMPRHRRNPLVLVGAAATATVLGLGLISFYQGNKSLAQTMMRYRVIAQGATVLIMTISSTQLIPMPAIPLSSQLPSSSLQTHSASEVGNEVEQSTSAALDEGKRKNVLRANSSVIQTKEDLSESAKRDTSSTISFERMFPKTIRNYLAELTSRNRKEVSSVAEGKGREGT